MINSGASFNEWIAAKVGTHKWVVFARLTQRLRNKGYEKALTQKRYRELLKEYEVEFGRRWYEKG